MMKLFIKTLIFISLLSFIIAAQERNADRINDALKGAVKYISTERSDVSVKDGKRIESETKLENEITYNRRGDRLTHKGYSYEDGFLLELLIYASADGRMISVEKDIEVPKNIEKNISENVNAKKESDSRFDGKSKDKNDIDGYIYKDILYQGNNKALIQYTYDNKGRQRRKNPDCGEMLPDQTCISIIGVGGNITETLIYDPKTDKTRAVETYEYITFDEKGNWTQRMTQRPENNDSKAPVRYEIQRRKIIYY